MSEPVRKSINQVVKNMLTVLAQQGDLDAIAALKRADELQLLEDDEDLGDESVTVVVSQAGGDFLITEQGATLIPKESGN
jgi:hypothetical protein